MGKIHTAGPNKAIIVCGRGGQRSKEVVVGSWVYTPPLICDTQSLSLGLMSLTLHCKDVITFEGVPLNVIGIAQCKFINSPEYLLIGAENFFGRNIYEIELSILQTLEGHLRVILSTLTVEEIIWEGEKIVLLFQKEVTTNVSKMGLQIISFVIKEICDNAGYLKSLGKQRIAEVKRDATVGMAMAERDAGIAEAECEKEASCKKYEALSNILRYSRLYYLEKFNFEKEVNTAKAEADLAYELAKAKIKQKICLEELNIKIIELKKGIENGPKEVECKNKRFMEAVKNPLSLESDLMLTVAGVEKTNVISEIERLEFVSGAQANNMKFIRLMKALFQMSEEGLCF